MQNLIIVLSGFIFSLGAQAATLSSVERVTSFSCQLTGASGVTLIEYVKNPEDLVTTTRNGIQATSYRLHSAGKVNRELTSSHLTFSGGGLLANAYISILFNDEIKSGSHQNLRGTVLYVVTGGSVFAPIMISNTPVGTALCNSLVVK
ncbi:MAG: hypothetical protein ACLGGX_07810 [Bdellovibrionia bacterium]